MSKVIKRAVISLLCLNGILQLSIFFIHFPFKEITFIPVRPPLTRPDPREALVIRGSVIEEDKGVDGLRGYSTREILEGLALLRKEKGKLLNKAQSHNIRPYLRKISYRKKRIDYLNRKVERIKRELGLACIKMGRILKRNQLDFVISDIDLLTLEVYEFPYWTELLNRLKLKSE